MFYWKILNYIFLTFQRPGVGFDNNSMKFNLSNENCKYDLRQAKILSVCSIAVWLYSLCFICEDVGYCLCFNVRVNCIVNTPKMFKTFGVYYLIITLTILFLRIHIKIMSLYCTKNENDEQM